MTAISADAIGGKSSEISMLTDLPKIPPPRRPVMDPWDAIRLQSKPMTIPPHLPVIRSVPEMSTSFPMTVPPRRPQTRSGLNFISTDLPITTPPIRPVITPRRGSTLTSTSAPKMFPPIRPVMRPAVVTHETANPPIVPPTLPEIDEVIGLPLFHGLLSSL